MKWKHGREKNHWSLLWARAAVESCSEGKVTAQSQGELCCSEPGSGWDLSLEDLSFQSWLHGRVSSLRAAYLYVKDICASTTCSSLHVPSSWCLGVLPYQNPYFWSFLRCSHCNHLLSCTHAPELITPMWANIPQRHWHRDHTALFKSHDFYTALNKCHDFYTYVWIAKGVVESSEQQNTGQEKLFAALWEFIQNCFFPSAAAKNLKPLGCPPMSPCFSYWSAVL